MAKTPNLDPATLRWVAAEVEREAAATSELAMKAIAEAHGAKVVQITDRWERMGLSWKVAVLNALARRLKGRATRAERAARMTVIGAGAVERARGRT